jgi:hypothetical protein
LGVALQLLDAVFRIGPLSPALNVCHRTTTQKITVVSLIPFMNRLNTKLMRRFLRNGIDIKQISFKKCTMTCAKPTASIHG